MLDFIAVNTIASGNLVIVAVDNICDQVGISAVQNSSAVDFSTDRANIIYFSKNGVDARKVSWQSTRGMPTVRLKSRPEASRISSTSIYASSASNFGWSGFLMDVRTGVSVEMTMPKLFVDINGSRHASEGPCAQLSLNLLDFLRHSSSQ